MAEKKFIDIWITVANNYGSSRIKAKIPRDINEVQLKACLRDLGYIPKYQYSYLCTKIFLNSVERNTNTEICIGDYRSLTELGIKEGSNISIVTDFEELF